jgi:hypothetical protein
MCTNIVAYKKTVTLSITYFYCKHCLKLPIYFYNISFFISYQIFSLFWMSSSTWIIIVLGLSPLYFNSNSPLSSLVLNSKLHGLSPRTNYTNRATAVCRRSNCQLVRIEGAMWSAWRITPAVYSRFSRQEPLLFYQVAPQLYSRGWVHPVPGPLFFFW